MVAKAVANERRAASNGRKIPPELENPFDDALLDLFALVHPALHRAGFTANGLTLISGAFQLLAVGCIALDAFGTAAVLYAVGYAFDVFDGNFARTYGSVSAGGDRLDHYKDITVASLLYLLIIFKDRRSIPLAWKAAFLGTSLLMCTAVGVFVGCQERFYLHGEKLEREGSAFLRPLRSMCTWSTCPQLRARLGWLRWLGVGTWVWFVCTFLVLLAARRALLLHSSS